MRVLPFMQIYFGLLFAYAGFQLYYNQPFALDLLIEVLVSNVLFLLMWTLSTKWRFLLKYLGSLLLAW